MVVKKKIDIRSGDSYPSGLDYHTIPYSQVAVDKTYEREFITLNPVNLEPYMFFMQTGSSHMIPDKTRVVTRWTMRKRDVPGQDGKIKEWADVKEEDDICVLNGMGAAWIQNMTVDLNGTEIFNPNSLYPYKVMLDNELNFGEDSKKSSMNSFGFYYENVGKTQMAKEKSEGWKARRDQFTDGKVVEFSAPLYADIFQQPLYLLSQLELRIEITKCKQEFLIHAPTYKGEIELELLSVRMYGTFCDLTPGSALAIEKTLMSEPARYPLRKTDIKTVFYDHQKTEAQFTAFADYVPKKVTMVMIPKKNYNGTYDTDASYFHHCDIRDVQVRAGNLVVPNVNFDSRFPTETNKKDVRFIRMFEHLHRTIGMGGNNLDCGINRKMFVDGYMIMPFYLTATLEDEDGFELVQETPTLVDKKFNKEIPDGGVVCLIVAEKEQLMFIDVTRTVRTDLSM